MVKQRNIWLACQEHIISLYLLTNHSAVAWNISSITARVLSESNRSSSKVNSILHTGIKLWPVNGSRDCFKLCLASLVITAMGISFSLLCALYVSLILMLFQCQATLQQCTF